MFRKLIFVLALVACCLLGSLAAVELSPRDLNILSDIMRGGNGYGQKVRRQSDSPWKTILEGLLRSQRFSKIAAQTPCDIITSLETDEYEAQQFVQQVEQGQVPTIIKDLPSEIIDAFTTIVDIALKLPQALLDDAEKAVSEAEHIFDDIEDGKIVQDIESLPGEIASDVTAVWGDVTSDLDEGWTALTHGAACFFGGGCASPTPGSCSSTSVPVPAAASQTPDYAGSTFVSAALSSAKAAASQAASTEAQATETSLRPANVSIASNPSASSQPTEAAATSSGVGITQWVLIGVVTFVISYMLCL